MFLFHKKCIHPKYWLLALVLAVFWVLAHLPSAWQITMGRGFAWLILRRVKKIKAVTLANVRACFPQLNEQEQKAFALRSIDELGVSLFETFLVWFREVDGFLRGRFLIEGDENLQAALDEERGVILLSCHFGSVDMNGALLSRLNLRGRKFTGTFRETDEVVNQFLERVRCKFCDAMVSAGDQRRVFRELKAGQVVWYAPDIEVKNKASAFVDFMGVPASTTLAISRLAKATNAIVVPVVHYRDENELQYRLKVLPSIDGFPSENPALDMRKVNAAIEEMIEPCPERYWWAIKRFKNRPDGEAAIY